ncbi:MAG: CaiB/BaiF CoA-transferase family protein [Haloarculaceae archaeon]
MRLDDVRVVDLTTLLPGPYGTQLLADLGADVVKVEPVDSGDNARYTPPLTGDGHGALFDAVNRGKRSVALDLKDERGREALYELVATADAFVEQFRPGVVDRLGVDYDTLREHNPDLVYCSLSGYGQSGPKSGKAAHDLNYIGLAGLLDMTRESDEVKPQMPGYPIADMAGGVFAAFSIVCALLSRELGGGTDGNGRRDTGSGEYVDCSLTDPVLSFSQSVAPLALSGEDPRPGETALTGGYPWYDVYECADGRYVTIAALEPGFWRGFCEAVDREDLLEYHMTEDEAELAALREELEALFASRTRDEWVEAIGDADATVDGVYTPAEAFEHPQVEAMEIVEEREGSLPRVGFPARGEGIPEGPLGDAPGHGEHTAELLREVGLPEGTVDGLVEAGVAEVAR